MSIGKLDTIHPYFHKNFKDKVGKFYLYNLAHEHYRGYSVEVYAASECLSLLSPVMQIYRKPPTNMRWFGV